MDGHEHRDIGNAAFGGGSVNLGGDSPAAAFWLGYGDLTALAGDYFALDGASASRYPELSLGDFLAACSMTGTTAMASR